MNRGLLLACTALATLTARADGAADLEGVWSGVLTAADHPYWRVEDHLCFQGCTPEAYAHIQDLLERDPRPVMALVGELFGFMHERLARVSTPAGLALLETSTPANDPSLECRPYGLVRQILSPLPMRVSRRGDVLIIDYEEWGQRRVVHLDNRARPPDLQSTAFGHSTGRDDEDAFVVETVGIRAGIYHPSSSGGGHSNQLRAVERYTVHDNSRRLELELTLHDPVTLREPYRFTKTWIAAPDLELVTDSCEDVPGQP